MSPGTSSVGECEGVSTGPQSVTVDPHPDRAPVIVVLTKIGGWVAVDVLPECDKRLGLLIVKYRRFCDSSFVWSVSLDLGFPSSIHFLSVCLLCLSP